MKKSMIVSGILFSGMILGSVVTPVVVQADGTATTTVAQKSVTVNYVDQVTKKPVGTEVVSGSVGTTKTLKHIPDGYVLASNTTSVTLMAQMGPSLRYDVVKSDAVKKITANVSYFDNTAQKSVGTEAVTGELGASVKLNSIPAGYELKNASDSSITIVDPNGNGTYDRIVLVQPSAAGTVTKYTGIATTGSTGAPIYDKAGNLIKARALGANTKWAIDRKLVLNGVTYYRVATNEFVKASDATITGNDVNTGTDTNTNPDTDDNISSAKDIQKADRVAVTTISDAPTNLYTIDGALIKGRALGGHTPWAVFKMATINGVKMYKVATYEWVKASDVE
ncbi:SLAP domain-containing protein [Companilactobacillus hulinensis]|uniref:SLAP domain-containing protein n=1 Tax=Companilactobacillus hulinensis TaxID=2486007 RepID=UPI000F7670C3|nr:SLAP domain-containing protein [Companilactobacillus hulinensis]